jgi:16S rRNA G527 N7-methylase RsmG
VLELSDVRVEQARLEDVAQRPSARYSFDLVTMRAVRPDEKLWEALRALLKPGGRLLWFGARDEAMPADSIVLEDRPVAMLLQMPGVGR